MLSEMILELMVRIIVGSGTERTGDKGGIPSPSCGLFVPHQVGLMATGIIRMVVVRELAVIVEFPSFHPVYDNVTLTNVLIDFTLVQ